MKSYLDVRFLQNVFLNLGLSNKNITDAECETLDSILNGKITGNTTYGSIVTYSCNPGYGLNGSSVRLCRSDKSWSGSPPTCEGMCIATFCR